MNPVTNVYLQGKAKEDEDSGCHGIGQLLMAMLTHFVECNGRNSIVGFTLSPSYVSLYLCPQSVHLHSECTCRYQYLIFRHCLGETNQYE